MENQQQLRNYRLMVAILVLSLLLILVFCVALYMTANRKEPAFYQVYKQSDGKLAGKSMLKLNNPIINKQGLLNWATDAATSTYTYDQANYKNQILKTVSTYFTKDGGKSFIDALNQSGVLKQLVTEKLEVTAVVEQPPAIIKAGVFLGVYTWKIQMPLLVTYVTASEQQVSRYIITMSVIRVPTSEYPSGIAIDQIWVKTSSK